MSASPVRARFHSSYLSPTPSPLCINATFSPNRARKLRSVCGVSEISGTSMIAFLPSASVRSIASIYTSVLPLPVTPNSRETVLSVAKMDSTALFWSSVGVTRFAPSCISAYGLR